MKKILLTILYLLLIVFIVIYIVYLTDKSDKTSSEPTSSVTATTSQSISSNSINLNSSSKESSSDTDSDTISSNVSSTVSSKVESEPITSSAPVSSSTTSKVESEPITSSAPVSSETTSKVQVEETLLDSSEPLPPVSEELQQLYLKGLEMYKWFYSGAMYSDDCYITEDGTKVPDERFKDYQSFYKYLLSIFPNYYIEERLLNDNYYNSDNGIPEDLLPKLERINQYEEHSFELMSESEDKIQILVHVTFNNNGKIHRDYPLIFEKEYGIWFISDFYLWYAPDGVSDDNIMIFRLD